MTWRPARSLTVLHTQLKASTRAAPPATGPDSWGLIGDAAHDPTSDHAPKDFPGWGDDIVTACDFPNAPALGLDAHAVLDGIRRSRDNRVKYAISNDQIFSSYATSTRKAWEWGPYNPNDPNRNRHYDHGHLSVVGDARADDIRPWATIGGSGDMIYCAYGETSDNVGLLQAILSNVVPGGLEVDRNYGDKTAAALRAALAPEDTANDGKACNYWVVAALLCRVIPKHSAKVFGGQGQTGPAGPAGPAGPPGPKGDAAVLPANAVLTITAA